MPFLSSIGTVSLIFNLFCLCLNKDDKKLGSVLKKFGLTDMKGLEEVNIFTDDGNVIHITNPKGKLIILITIMIIFRPDICLHICSSFSFLTRSHLFFSNELVQASIPSNTYVVSGTVETKRLDELLPGILNQVGEESMDKLRQYANSTVNNGQVEEEEDDDDDDDVPDLVENFEEAAAK